MDSYLESLEDEVFLKNNIVTYKWVIKHLRVPSNVAKQILYQFVETKRSCNETVSATYMISGDRKSPDGTLVHEVCIIPDSQLDSVKSKFEVVTAVHVYAIHKSPLQDVNILYSVDYQEFHSNSEDGQRSYSITCSTLKFRCTETPKSVKNEIANGPKDKALPPKTNEQLPPKTKDQPQISRKRPNGDLDRLFSKVAKREKVEKPESLPLSEHKTPLTTEENYTPVSKKIISDESPAELFKKNAKSSKASAEKITESKINSEDSKNKSNASAKKVNESKIKADKSKKNSVKTDFNGKKRRRIIQMSDSSEDEDQSDNHEEEEPVIKMPVIDDTTDPVSPASPEKQPVKTSEVLSQTRHKRVLVNETTLDEDGYLVTQKVWKDETEVVKENKPSVVKAKPVEDKPVLRQKQSTLMNFFKKK